MYVIGYLLALATLGLCVSVRAAHTQYIDRGTAGAETIGERYLCFNDVIHT